ncbi:hypothetical protein [Chitinophaga sp. CF418]|uniref:hypothetical protein n=1 Tax=Chitinophaga sp. CF418 TaxID=1855287 RepID=UPI0009187155|nr:hypothetical protein [Chitinophaga sp. CF418]SHN39347.1 hypothetical protein SAMN05216311_111173 [Chitinophaga sp. CF418]
MEFNKVRELLDRYWDGTSTLEEEEVLRSFFSREIANLPADLKEAQPLFRYFAEESDIPMPVFPDIEMPVARTPERPVRQMIWQHWMKYAAMLLVAVGIGYAARQVESKQDRIMASLSEQDTFDDPEKAFAVTQKALQLLSRNLNKGTAQMQKLAYFNDATEKIKAN